MKHYCKNCDSTIVDNSIFYGKHCEAWGHRSAYKCPMCAKESLCEIPDFETVPQWEARTGREYPDTAPVYCLIAVDLRHGWSCNSFSNVRAHGYSANGCLVATEAGAPPDDWRPEDDDV